MSSKTIFIIQKARQLGLTKKEFEANYEVREYSRGFYYTKRDELVRREEKRDKEIESWYWDSFSTR